MLTKNTKSKPQQKASQKWSSQNLLRALKPNKHISKKKKRVKKQSVSNRFLLSIGGLFVLVGLLLGYEPFLQYWHIRQISTNSFSTSINTQPLNSDSKVTEFIQGKPVRIEIPSVGINIPVTDGFYNYKTKTWTLSKDKAHYGTITAMPNNRGGNTFIYGHNRKEVFSKLGKLKMGQDAMVYTDNGHIFTYRFRNSYETNPNDDSLFRYQGPPILTLQTCSGLWYENRLLMTLDLIKVK